jgi:hypothetical protein
MRSKILLPMPDMLPMPAGVLFGTRLKTSTENSSRAVPRYLLLVTHISEIDRKNLVGPAGTKFSTYRRVDLVPGVHTGHPVF